MEGEIRCSSRIHGKVVDGRFEVKCRSKRCGAGQGTIVFHYFDLLTSDLLETKKFSEPARLFQAKEAARCR